MILALQNAPAFISLDPTGTNDVLGAWLVCFFTLAVFSFLFSDNPFYKFAEHVFVGLGTAYFTLQYYEEGVLQPIFEYIAQAREHAAAGEPQVLAGIALDPLLAIGLRVTALVLALMLLVRLFKPSSWAPRWPLAIMVGVYAALKMTGETQSKLVLMIANTIQPMDNPLALSMADASRIEETALWFTLTRVVFYVGLVSALAHFLFTLRRGPALRAVSRVGVVTLMITFGSMFGFTVLGRIALLIERVSDLDGYATPAYSLAGGAGSEAVALLFSPPVLLAVLIAALLAVGARRRAA